VCLPTTGRSTLQRGSPDCSVAGERLEATSVPEVANNLSAQNDEQVIGIPDDADLERLTARGKIE